jgi:hypothetical protein
MFDSCVFVSGRFRAVENESDRNRYSGGGGLCVCIIRARNQTLIFGIIYIENVKVIPTFRINFLNFPWQLLGASGPAGFTCLSCIVTQFI